MLILCLVLISYSLNLKTLFLWKFCHLKLTVTSLAQFVNWILPCPPPPPSPNENDCAQCCGNRVVKFWSIYTIRDYGHALKCYCPSCCNLCPDLNAGVSYYVSRSTALCTGWYFPNVGVWINLLKRHKIHLHELKLNRDCKYLYKVTEKITRSGASSSFRCHLCKNF